MQPIFRVVVTTQMTEHRVAHAEEADALCDELAVCPILVAHVYGESGFNPSLCVIVVSGRASVSYVDMARRVKLASRDQLCTERATVSLRDDAYPDIAFDQVEVPRRSIISPDHAITILRHYLKTGRPVGLVPWPSPDESEWYGDPTPDSA